jgi:hypothetical protein
MTLLDFSGQWIMKNGQLVTIHHHGTTTDKDGILLEGVWIGEIDHKLTYWDNDGKHLTDDKYNLMERPRG